MSNARNISKLASLAAHVTNLVGLSTNKSAIDAAAAGASAFPSGAIIAHAGSAAPSGWLAADGSAISRTTYAALFTALGTTHGVGNGTTTFNLPDLRGRTIAGLDNGGAGRLTAGGSGITGTTLGATGGVETHTLTTAQMPSHSHTGTSDVGGSHSHTANAVASGSGTVVGNGATAVSANATITTTTHAGHSHTFTTATAGTGGAHNNTQPTIVLNYIIKT